MANPIDYWYQKYLALKAKMDEIMNAPLPEDTVPFNKGVAEGKRLMMEEAVEGEITTDNRGNNVLRAGVLNNGFEVGDKVKIIVINE